MKRYAITLNVVTTCDNKHKLGEFARDALLHSEYNGQLNTLTGAEEKFALVSVTVQAT